MGTNYYAKLNIEECIQDALYISPLALNCIENFELHIGKSSKGWKFEFQEQEISDIKLDSFIKWKEFLNGQDILIYNEYNELIDKEEFFNLVKEKQKEIHPTKEEIEQYYPDITFWRFEDKEGYNFNRGDFS